MYGRLLTILYFCISFFLAPNIVSCRSLPFFSFPLLHNAMVNSGTGTLTANGIVISVSNVMSLAIKGSTKTIAEAGTYHQVKSYSTTTGTLSQTLGRKGRYGTDATIYNDKFYCKDSHSDPATFSFVAYQRDDALWVGYKCNYRHLKYNSSRVYQTQIAFLLQCYNTYVDFLNYITL